MTESKIQSSTIDASPTKTFFVDMLVRDIELEDAILDLLDNCVDGIQRTIKDRTIDTNFPYQEFWAKINFSDREFTIEDNCGGIPLTIAEKYAFRMGRPNDANDNSSGISAIGTYGIGMKRAIFKIGKYSKIISQTADTSFRVTISNEWMNNSENWDLPLEKIERLERDNGTIVKIGDLKKSIGEEFSSSTSTFANTLFSKIAHSYSYIINKGFSVYVNNKKVEVRRFQLLWQGQEKINYLEKAIAPYLFKATNEEVSIELALGFYRKNFGNDEEIEQDNEGNRRTSEHAGWSIVCNDRVVVYCDKTKLTGWGEARVPSYHPQFISIAGVVHFRSPDPRKLPITTTKRGLDLSSDLYLSTKNFMREGLKLFTNYTNKWKKDIPREKEIMKTAEFIDIDRIFELIPETIWKSSKKFVDGKYYQPSLPLPDINSSQKSDKNIRFSRNIDEIKIVAEYLFEDEDRDINDVGNECFEKVLKEAQA